MASVHVTLWTALPTLNAFYNTAKTPGRRGMIVANAMKREAEKGIEKELLAAKVPPFLGQVFLHYRWFRKHRREDLDNIAFGQKFVQDAMVKVGVVQNDGWRHIAGFTHTFAVDKADPRPEIVTGKHR